MRRKSKLFFLKNFLLCLLVFTGAIFVQQELRANNSQDVVINEVAWMGAVGLPNSEWIELKNFTGSEISLEGWTLAATDNTPTINLSGSIEANGYFLLERTSDDTVPGITADLIYTGALGNSGEVLELYDSESNLIDSVDASTGWPAGDNTNKLTMERCNGLWQDSATASGTPRAINSCAEPVCGDGNVEEGEECDDGNNDDGDGCSALCIIEYCGDNIINNVNEICDNNSQPCTISGYTGVQSCNITCDGWDSCLTSEYCGDGVVNGFEECDDGNTDNNDGCSAQCIIEGEEEPSAKTIKEEVRNTLEEIETDNWWINKKINKILKYLDKSLTADWWQDNTHLNSKKGMKVFINESLAVLKIKSLLHSCYWCKNFSLPEELKPVLEQAIIDLVKADKILAQVALDGAKSTSVNNPGYQERYNRMIKQAEAKFNKAEGCEENEPRRAIYYYRKAWWFSQRAMQYAMKD